MSVDIEFAIRKDIRNNPVVRELDSRQKHEFRSIVLLASLTVALLLFSAWQHFEIVSHGYEIERLRVQIASESTINRQLRLNLETLRAPQEIERRARREIGLTAPTDADTIVIERSRVAAPSHAMIAMAR
jgi:hypothetical protein